MQKADKPENTISFKRTIRLVPKHQEVTSKVFWEHFEESAKNYQTKEAMELMDVVLARTISENIVRINAEKTPTDIAVFRGKSAIETFIRLRTADEKIIFEDIPNKLNIFLKGDLVKKLEMFSEVDWLFAMYLEQYICAEAPQVRMPFFVNNMLVRAHLCQRKAGKPYQEIATYILTRQADFKAFMQSTEQDVQAFFLNGKNQVTIKHFEINLDTIKKFWWFLQVVHLHMAGELTDTNYQKCTKLLPTRKTAQDYHEDKQLYHKYVIED
jgi:hypothetical protein